MRRLVVLLECPREPPEGADRRARYGWRCFCRRSFETRPGFARLTGCCQPWPRSGSWRQATTAAASSASALRRTRSRSRGATSSPRTVRSARNAPTAWCSAADVCTGAPSRRGDPQPVLRALVVRHHGERGEPGVDRAQLAARDAVAHDRRELVDQLLALGPVAGERLAVAGGEAVDLVEVVGQGAQGGDVGTDRTGRAAPRAEPPAARDPGDELERDPVRLADDLVEQLALAAEVVVERRLLQPAPARDLGHRRARDAALGEQLARGGEDLATRVAVTRADGRCGAGVRCDASVGLAGGDHAGTVARVRNGRVNSTPRPLTGGRRVPHIERQLSTQVRNPPATGRGDPWPATPPDTSSTVAARDHARAQAHAGVPCSSRRSHAADAVGVVDGVGDAGRAERLSGTSHRARAATRRRVLPAGRGAAAHRPRGRRLRQPARVQRRRSRSSGSTWPTRSRCSGRPTSAPGRCCCPTWAGCCDDRRRHQRPPRRAVRRVDRAAQRASGTATAACTATHPNARDLLRGGAGEARARPARPRADVNLFKGVRVDDDGALRVRRRRLASRRVVELRAELPVIVVVANTPHVLDPRARLHRSTPLRVTAWTRPPTTRDDPLVVADPRGRARVPEHRGVPADADRASPA